MAKEKEPHLDIFGQPLSKGSYVAVSHHNELQICQISKLNPKMMRVKPLTGYYKSDGYLAYSDQSVLLSGPDALAYILKHAGPPNGK
jgi:hypothetical protein